jgi:hypothetical protein
MISSDSDDEYGQINIVQSKKYDVIDHAEMQELFETGIPKSLIKYGKKCTQLSDH